MLTERLMQGIALVFLGCGAVGAADMAAYFQQPFFAFGYLVAAAIFLVSGIVRLLRAF